MTRTNNDEHPRAVMRDRHISRNTPKNAKPMKKSGGGKGNWGVDGSEMRDAGIPVNEAFDDEDYREEERVKPMEQNNNKIQVISQVELENMTSSSEEWLKSLLKSVTV